MDLETKKLILNLLFKNIKIAHKKIFSFEFFAPFNFLFFEEKQKCQTKILKRVTNFLPPKSLSGLSADPLFALYKLSKPFFFTSFQVELEV